MTLGSDNMQTAEFDYLFVFSLTFLFELIVIAGINISRSQEFLILERDFAGSIGNRIFFVPFLAHFLLRLELRISAEDDIGPSAGHVGRDRDRSETACFRDDRSLTLVMLCVQYIMTDAPLIEQCADLF